MSNETRLITVPKIIIKSSNINFTPGSPKVPANKTRDKAKEGGHAVFSLSLCQPSPEDADQGRKRDI